MNPVRQSAVIDFMEWVRRDAGDVRSFCDLGKEKFLSLVVDYELSKGVAAISDPDSNLYRKWESAQWVFSRSDSDIQALHKLR